MDHGPKLGMGAAGSNRRTKAAGSGPRTRASVSTVFSTLATRPNASAAAQKPMISDVGGGGVAPHDLDRIRHRVFAVVVLIQRIQGLDADSTSPPDYQRFLIERSRTR